MNLRILRTYTWEFDPSMGPMRIGGDNPVKLVASDRLQYHTAQGQWKDVPVVEEPRPPHPNEKRYEMSAEDEEFLKKIADGIAEKVRQAKGGQ